MNRKIFLGVGLLPAILAVFLISCSGSGEKETVSEELGEAAIPVEVHTVERSTVREKISSVGTVEARQDVIVSAEGGGKVVELGADVGDAVKKGDVIIRLDDELRVLGLAQAEAQAAMAKANYQKAKRDLIRSEELFGTKNISESEFEIARLGGETAQASLKSAEVALKVAERQLADTEVKSPIAGKVAERYVDVGEMVAPGTPVATVVDLSQAKVLVLVSESEIAGIKVGQRSYLTVVAYPGERFEGRVSKVGLKADSQTRSFPVEIVVPANTNERLRSGMIARAEIEVKTFADVLLVPQDAILDRSGEKVVYVVGSDKAAERSLTLGRQWDEMVIVEQGLQPGDRLVTAGQEKLSEGTRVRVE